jgi:hypothetical protein
MGSSQIAPARQDEAGTLCVGCSAAMIGNFCHGCGEQQHHPHELSFKHYVVHTFHELTHLDAKLLVSIRYLFTRPGFLTQEYLSGRRRRYMKPMALFLLSVALLFLADAISPRSGYDVNTYAKLDKTGQVDHLWDIMAAKKHVPKEVLLERMQETIHKISTAAQFIDVFVMCAMLAMFYQGRYFGEHLTTSFHYLALCYLATVLFWPITPGVGAKPIYTAAYLIGAFAIVFVYLVLSLRRVYGGSILKTIAKSIPIYAAVQLFMVVTMFLTFIVAMIVALR